MENIETGGHPPETQTTYQPFGMNLMEWDHIPRPYGYGGHGDPIICGFGKPSAFPRQLLDAVGLK